MFQLFLLSAGVFVLVWVAWNLHLGLQRRYGPRLNFPVVGSPSDRDYRAAIVEGYKKYPDSPFIVPMSPPLVIMPMSVYLESKQHPGCDFNAESYERFLGRWTGVGTNRDEVTPTIRQDLTKSIASILPLIQSETHYAFDKELGRPDDWTPIRLHATMLRMVALLSGRVFVGHPLNRNEEWLDASINYTTALAGILRDTMTWNPLLIPFVGGFLPSVRKSREYLGKAQKWMKPLVAGILSQEPEKSGPVKVGTRGTFISWLLNYLPEQQRTAERIGMDQMLVSFAAIHTTSSTGSIVLLDLAARPQYIQPLRDEIEAVLAEDGEELDDEGLPYIRKSSFAKMRKLDSFIRESQRFNSLGLVTPPRKTIEDVTFSNGLKLPRGTRFGFPTYAINMSNENPALSPSQNIGTGNLGPEVFDGFRFAKLREIAGRESKHQCVTTGLDNLVFGHGPHACPGRFFAIYEVKALVIELLRNYDIRLAGDVEGKGAERAPTMRVKMSNIPDPRAMLEIRARAR